MQFVRQVGATAVAVLLLAPVVVTSHADAAVPDGTETEDGPVPPGEGEPRARMVVNGLQAVVGPPPIERLPETEEQLQLPSSLTARVLIENQSDRPLDDLDLVVETYRRATSRSALRVALDGEGPGIVNGLGRQALAEPVGTIAPGGFAQVDIEVDAVTAGLIDPDAVVSVHPVVLSLVRGQFGVLDEVRIGAVGVSRAVTTPMEAAVVLPLDGPVPATDDQLAAQATALLPGGRLDRVLRAVEAAPPGTVTLAPAAHTLEDLSRLADEAVPGATDITDRIRAAVSDDAAGVVSSPYALADVPALDSDPRTAELAGSAVVAGRRRLLDLVGVVPDGAHLATAIQTGGALDRVPTDVLVTAWDRTMGPDLDENPSADVPPALRTGRTPAGRVLDVLVADPWVSRQLAAADGEGGWAVDAQRALAETAITYAQAPSRSGRALAVLPPTAWEAPGRLADELVVRLAAAPWLRVDDPVTVAGRSRVRDAWEPLETVPPARTLLLPQLASVEERLDGFAAAVAEVETQPAVVEDGDDLLRAVSVWPTSSTVETGAERGRTVLDLLDRRITSAVGEVVVPDNSVVTLTSERGTIPVTVQHPDGVPMDVVVEVATTGRLTFDDGTSRTVRIDDGATTTVTFEARALARGTFPLEVMVRTPDGQVELASSEVSVRASAVSRPALIAIGVVVVLLLVAGWLRRPSRPRLEVVR